MSILRRKMKPSVLLICGALAFGPILAACDDKEGSAEKLGETIDKSVEQAGDKLEGAMDRLKEETDYPLR